jgi:SM-20-related protein
MTTPEAAALFNLYTIKDFLDEQRCGEIITELSAATENLASVYGMGEGGTVDERVRKATRLLPHAETVERLTRQLLMVREEVGAHFGISLSTCEDPQFLRYRVGDFFVAHQDGNTGMMLSEREQSRKISVVIFLNRQSETSEADSYGGGSLVFSEWRASRTAGHYSLNGEVGMLVAFPAETTHEVIPVTRGERYSIVSWYG